MVFCAFTAAALQHTSDLSSPWKLNTCSEKNGSLQLTGSEE